MSSVEWVTAKALREELEVSQDAFDKWVKAGTVPTYRKLPNRRLLFDRRDIEDWLDSRKVVPVPVAVSA
jgi:predicted DNA-binding transcriptional regulator AlpA